MNRYIVVLLVCVLFGCVHGISGMRGEDKKKCIDGVQSCTKECACGYGYKTCANGRWYQFESPVGTVCVQNKTEVYFEPISDRVVIEEVCGNKYKRCSNCINGRQKCVKECDCYSGYMECTNGEFVHVNVENKVCKQKNPMSIELVLPGSRQCPAPTGNCQLTTTPNVCIDGLERCIKDCSCGFGYEICSNNKWYRMNVPDGALCAQVTPMNVTLVAINDEQQIEQYCPTGLHGCGVTTHRTDPVGCMNGYERCDLQCVCGAGYEVCEHNIWIHNSVPKGVVCSQITPTDISLVSIYDQLINYYCPSGVNGPCDYTTAETAPFICVEGVERCDAVCSCGSGYRVCDHNRWIHMEIPNGAVCGQVTPTNITLVAIDDVEQISEYCPTGLHNCGETTVTTKTTRTTEPSVCVEGVERCDIDCTCGFGYKVCDHDKWIHMNVPAGTVCAQDAYFNITLVAIDDDLQIAKYCPTGLHNCGETTVTTKTTRTTEPPVCVDGVELCIEECACGYGYKTCANGKWFMFDSPIGSVCIQNKTEVYFEPIINQVIIKEICGDKYKPCAECVDGQERCVKDCSCGFGYEICSNNKWYRMRIPEGTVCAQVTYMSVTLVAINDEQQINQYCPTGLHDCGITTHHTDPVGCVNGEEKCGAQCICGATYDVCQHNIWITHELPRGDICKQISPTSIAVVSIYDQQINYYCPNGVNGDCDLTRTTAPLVCVEGVERCEFDCTCGYGYKICDHNKWIHMNVPAGTVCAQDAYFNVTLVAIDDDAQIARYCPTGLHGNCDITAKTTAPLTCINGYEKCLDECHCGSGYYLCDQNQWRLIPISQNTVCAQNGTLVYLEYGCDRTPGDNKCSDRITGDCDCPPIRTTFEDPSTIIDQGICKSPNGYYCKNQCKLDTGYYHCVNGIPKYSAINDKNVCWQSSDGVIQLVHAYAADGYQFGCDGKVYK